MSARSRKRVCLQKGAPRGGRRWVWLVAGASGALAAQAANADPQVVLPNGLPVQVKPTYSEPGLPTFSFPTGGGSLLGGSTGSVDTGNGGATGARARGSGGSGDAYNTMMAQSWGSAAANAAGAMGVSATALAATCVMESNCQNVGASGGGSASGAFQMINSTYTADINGAVAYDPAISGSIMSGLRGKWTRRRRLMRRRMSCAQTRWRFRATESLTPPCYRRARSISLVATSVPMSLPPTIRTILQISLG